MAVLAIGDRANGEILDRFEKSFSFTLDAKNTDLRCGQDI